MATSKEIASFFLALQDAYPNYAPKDAARTVALFQKMLMQYDAKALDFATEQIIRKYKFFPAISEIIELVDDLPAAPQGGTDLLRAMALELPLEASEWYRMAAVFEGAGRTSAAEHAYSKAQRIEAQ